MNKPPSYLIERSGDKQLPCLKLTLKTGVSYGIQYSHIIEKCYLPSNEVRLLLPHVKVSILGSQLMPVYNGLCQNRIIEIREDFQTLGNSNPLETYIIKLEITGRLE